MKCVPKIDAAYWTSLSLASVFGANAGDFIADVVHLGHLSGIPYLAGWILRFRAIYRSVTTTAVEPPDLIFRFEGL